MRTTVQVRGVAYSVLHAGDGGECLLLLHGFTGNGDVFAPFLASWAQRWTVLAPDLLGHGRTAAPTRVERYRMDEQLADLATLLATFGFQRAHVLGYSMGGRIALSFAVRYPECVRRLVLESSSPGLATAAEQAERRAADERLAADIEEMGLPAFLDRWEKIPLFATHDILPEPVRMRQREIREQGTAFGYAQSLRGIGTGAQPSNWDRLGELAMPTLLVTGALDTKFTEINRRMAGRMKVARHVVIEEAGHTPHLEQASAFAATVESHL
ncbi:2-succinyl-6-hydroxy-2,4-cyclohexadiene-1-carboxylate synthase [Alicyclobacillus sacchari]|uniref:Putative 2-succinyl-6-hydroxy-2,4-cyclohexadiene-1-carboxylate synthase n=1 Tax=Alicyclobacillus sacchari TaxID=392010 RepID=A0A4V3HEI8_9BACL|nr:2-succinyl-6-hydroxy-2,4-cyclohexadiene-1-carboxylate synthase [Alicyclobacillus sacchari]TDY47929.1 2-succinyl-6-hydroxy-2,4-cyclohexadiene-1-carboxylate synthase [Alicyclobacillus sacchari]GMA56037.1 putative 2-succinyl-6-hydroxy-2,4-cyclohexadiene-1-carboxylate synthase [Alicyclobacillus sacchari]